MRTSAAVPPGARLSRRISSWPRGSAASWSAAPPPATGLAGSRRSPLEPLGRSRNRRRVHRGKRGGPSAAARVAVEDDRAPARRRRPRRAARSARAELDDIGDARPRSRRRGTGRSTLGPAPRSRTGDRRRTRRSFRAHHDRSGSQVAIPGKAHKSTIATNIRIDERHHAPDDVAAAGCRARCS